MGRDTRTLILFLYPFLPSSFPSAPSYTILSFISLSGKTFTMEGIRGGKVVPAAAAAPTAAAAAAASGAEKGEGTEEEAMENGREGDDAPPSSSDDLPLTAGVNPRALAELFRLKEEKEERGLAAVNVSVSMVEIYNENVRDLLASPPSLPPLPPGVDKTKDKGYQAALAARRRWQPPSLEIKHQQPALPPAAPMAKGSSSSSSVGSSSSNSGCGSKSTSSGSQKKGASSSSSCVGSSKSNKSSCSNKNSNCSSTTVTISSSGVAGGAVYLPGAVSLPVDRAEDVTKIMRMGQRHRTVAATKANQASSRSHSLLLVSVHTKDAATGIITTGRLILVDLAGSERLGKVSCQIDTPLRPSPPPPPFPFPFSGPSTLDTNALSLPHPPHPPPFPTVTHLFWSDGCRRRCFEGGPKHQ